LPAPIVKSCEDIGQSAAKLLNHNPKLWHGEGSTTKWMWAKIYYKVNFIAYFGLRYSLLPLETVLTLKQGREQ